MEGKEEVEASLIEDSPTWGQFLSLWLRRCQTGNWGRPTSACNKWGSQVEKETCLHIISLDFAGHLIALCKPVPAIYHLTTVFVICRDFILGMTPFLCKCDTSKKQGLHMLCPHCLKHFFSTCLGNLAPKYADLKTNMSEGRATYALTSVRHTPIATLSIGPHCGRSSQWAYHGCLRSRVESLLSAFHNPQLSFCCVPWDQTSQVPSYLSLPYPWLSTFQIMKQINLFPKYIT